MALTLFWLNKAISDDFVAVLESSQVFPIAEKKYENDISRVLENFTGGGGVFPYMGHIGTCRGIGYGFWRFSISFSPMLAQCPGVILR